MLDPLKQVVRERRTGEMHRREREDHHFSRRAALRAAGCALAALAGASGVLAQAAHPTEVRFPIRDSLAVIAYVYRGAAGAGGPTLLLFHQGGGSARGEYRAITPRLLREGYNVIAADIRGGGDRFGAPNRAGSQGADTFRYCDAVAEVEATVSLARAQGLTGPLVLWGSSYSATLVLQVGARRAAEVRAVLAFSPASGEPMRGCEPAPYVGRLARAGIPTMVLRPRVELDDESRAAGLEAMRRDGATIFIAERGVHGSSMLDAERTGGTTEPQWNAVIAFLRRALRPRPPVQVTYLANEGVMLQSAAGRVLIDALFGEGLPEYAVVPKGLRDSLERALEGFGGPAVVLTTHAHRDHFDAAALGRYLGSNAEAVAVGPPETGTQGSLSPVDPGWVRVQPLAIPHGPSSRPVRHTGIW